VTKRLLIGCVVGIALVAAPAISQPEPSMTAHFINVGQAHATLLEFTCGAILIDAGAQDEAFQDALVNYLEQFFTRRSDLSRTLDSILITHNHIDHTRALRRIVETFTVERFLDNGFTTGSGTGGPNWLKKEVASGNRNVVLREIMDAEVETADHAGLTDADIDPVACTDRNPQIRILQGSFRDTNPGWPDGEFENQNNHSLITRVDFGSASFVFMGDLEVAGIELLVDYYNEVPNANRLLDADVLQVGHHGSYNATTVQLLGAVTPRVAVIPVGFWQFGQAPSDGRFATFDYGHPRRYTVELLASRITRNRSQAKSIMVADRAEDFSPLTVSRAIYATGWDGTVRVVARSTGSLTVFREH
jgi:beta-lactamase superfamily II metal-dependent hydrolase